MKEQTIYDALRILYQRGDLEGEDLMEFRKWKKSKRTGEKFEMIIEREGINESSCINW